MKRPSFTSKRISAKEAARILGVSVSSLQKGLAGTAGLTRVSAGRRRLYLEDEVLKLAGKEELVRAREAAKILGLSVSSLQHNGAGTSRLTRIRRGRLLYFRREELQRFPGF